MKCPECGSLKIKKSGIYGFYYVEWTDEDGDLEDSEIWGEDYWVGPVACVCLKCGYSWDEGNENG